MNIKSEFEAKTIPPKETPAEKLREQQHAQHDQPAFKGAR